MQPIPFRIQSHNTKFFAVSSPSDKPGQEIDTKPGKDSIPEDSVLFTSAPIVNAPPSTVQMVEFTGVSGLYVSLKGDTDKTKLTWSNEEFSWIVRKTHQGTYVVNPANGGDLYWFDEFNVGVGNHIEARRGDDIRAPQNEWVFFPA